MIETKINTAIKDSQSLLSDISQSEEKLAELNLLKNRFEQLHSQYESDLERLTLIVDGERLLNEHLAHNENHNCPFCNNNLGDVELESYIEASRLEFNNISVQLKDLSEVQQEILDDINTLETDLKVLHSHKTDVDSLINAELIPKANQIKKTIQEYETYINLQQEIASMEKVQKRLQADLEAIENESASVENPFKPKEKFESKFYSEMTSLLDNLLCEFNYRPESLRSVFFAKELFDVKINGELKSEGNGHGYTSFINSVVVMAFRKYLNDHAKFKPNLFIIDTPLLGLDEGDKSLADENMQKALFQYFIDTQTDGQLIIVENSKGLPALNYAAQGANQIIFTQDKNSGRYGFLEDLL